MAITQREAFARVMEHYALDDSHGYSQPGRFGDGTTETVDLGDGATVTLAGGDRDCSSAVVSALKAVGVDTYAARNTRNLRSELLRNPLFRWEPMGVASARRGDIYLREGRHTAVCTDGDPDLLAEMNISENGTISGREGDQTGREGRIVPYYSYPWDGKVVWAGDGEAIGSGALSEDEGSTEGPGAIAEDGLWGEETSLLLQQVLGCEYVDGVISRQNARWRSICPGCTGGWQWLDSGYQRGSGAIMAVQERIGVEADGLIGPATINALIAYEMGHGSGATVCDGRLDRHSKTIRQMQRDLNQGFF